MNFLRAVAASLLSLVCTVSVSGFVTLATLQTTLLDRQEVKGWLQNSGVYKNAVSAAVSNNQTVQDQTASDNTAVSQGTIKTALNQTFTAPFVQQQSEKVIDSTFDWLDGKQPTIAFNVDTTAQKDAFVSNLASVLQPQLASLPQCSSLGQFDASNPTCLPPGTTAQQLAQSLATDAGNSLGFFQQPITNDSLAKANAESGQSNTNLPLTSSNSSAQQIPSITGNLRLWLIWLPIIAVVSGALSVLLSRDRLKAAKHVARRLTFGLIVTFVVGLIVANIGKTIKLSDFTNSSNAFVSNIIEPIIHQAAPAIGGRLAIVSGIAGLITLALWITFQTLWENKERAKLLTVPAETSAAKTPSKTPVNSQYTSPKDEHSDQPNLKDKLN